MIRWQQNCTSSFVLLIQTYRFKTPQRIERLQTHIHNLRQTQVSTVSMLAWSIRLLCKCLDVFAVGELYNLFGQLLKPNTRPLTPLEQAEARRVFANTLPYRQIRIDEFSLLAGLGAVFRLALTGGLRHLGVVIAYTINFTRPIHPAPGNEDMAWLIHELTHVAQMEQVGLQYYPEALHAQFTSGYTYPPEALVTCRLSEFNREQQGEVIRDYYRSLERQEEATSIFKPLIDDLHSGRL